MSTFISENGAYGLGGTPLDFLYSCCGQSWATGVIANCLYLGLLLFAQWAFLRPRSNWAVQLTKVGRPLKSTVISAAAMAMLLTIGFIALVLEIPNWWEKYLDNGWPTFFIEMAMLLLWGLWACIFFIYWRRGDRYTQLNGMIRNLVKGSILEAIVAIPVHVWAMRDRNCYCARGSYTALVFSGTVLLWAFGPGVILLYMQRRHRRARCFPECRRCNYLLRGLPPTTTQCPECGHPFDRAELAL